MQKLLKICSFKPNKISLDALNALFDGGHWLKMEVIFLNKNWFFIYLRESCVWQIIYYVNMSRHMTIYMFFQWDGWVVKGKKISQNTEYTGHKQLTSFLQVRPVFSKSRPTACTYRLEPHLSRLSYATAPFGPLVTVVRQLSIKVSCARKMQRLA